MKSRSGLWLTAWIGLAVILACSFGPATSSPQSSVPTVVAATLQALTSAAPAGNTVSYNNVSFVIPGGLANGASSQTVPVGTAQNSAPWEVAPQHTEFKLTGYNLPSGYFQVMMIDVYPAQDYAAVYDGASIGIQRLQAFLASPSSPVTTENLPQVPYFNAGALFDAKVKIIHFANGSGVRMVTQYGQAVGPVINAGTFYDFEGLSSDGKYYLVVVLPVEAPFLPSGANPTAAPPAGGIPFPDYNNPDHTVFDHYYQAITEKMNATPDDVFQPSLSTLDSLVQSIQLNP